MAKRTKEEKSKREKSGVPLVKSKAEIDPALASLFAQSVSNIWSHSYSNRLINCIVRPGNKAEGKRNSKWQIIISVGRHNPRPA